MILYIRSCVYSCVHMILYCNIVKSLVALMVHGVCCLGNETLCLLSRKRDAVSVV